jgi:hypothetical protein
VRAGRKFGKTYTAVRVARDWACDADPGAYVLVAAPQVNLEVTMNPGVDADIQTAYRARAGEARLSQLEG